MFRNMNFELALENARSCSFMLRNGDRDNDHKMANSGVRIIVSNFGNYQPFVLTTNTKDWIKKTYNLKEKQVEHVYGLLVVRAKRVIKDTEKTQAYRPSSDCLPGTNIKYLTNDFGPRRTLFGVEI